MLKITNQKERNTSCKVFIGYPQKLLTTVVFFLFLVCDILSNGVTGVFGPAAGDTAPIVQSICDYKEIPHIQTRWDINQKHGLCQINLYPHPSTLAKVVTELKHPGSYPVSVRGPRALQYELCYRVRAVGRRQKTTRGSIAANSFFTVVETRNRHVSLSPSHTVFFLSISYV